MKHLKTWIFLFSIIFCFPVSYSQEITTGTYSGVNFADNHGRNYERKRESEPDTVKGFYHGWENETNSNPKSTGDSSKKKVTIAFSDGLNVSWNGINTDRGEYSGCFGPSVGFSIRFPLWNGFSFISGVSFERKGYSMKDSSVLLYMHLNNGTPMYKVNTKVLLDYAVVPILISIPIGKSQMFFFNTGPWFGLKLDAWNVGDAYLELHSESSYQLWKNTVNDNIERYLKNNDIGWIFSTRASLPLFRKYNVTLSLQYSEGFKNVWDKTLVPDHQIRTVANYEIRNRTISFLIGFTIPPLNQLKK
jgi:hypothetical protein